MKTANQKYTNIPAPVIQSNALVRPLSRKLRKAERSFFFFAFFVTSFLLALRPIPSLFSANDTGRYVDDFHKYCNWSLEIDESIVRAISYRLFYAVTSPACLPNSQCLFLFIVALFLPTSFLIFIKWREGTFFWSLSVLFSVFGLELAANAMRQGLSTMFFFAALAAVNERRLRSVIFCLLSLASHTSSVVFLPIYLYSLGIVRLKGVAVIAIFACVCLQLGYIGTNELSETAAESEQFYSEIYKEQLNISFIVFMALPLLYVWFLRFLTEKSSMSRMEHLAALYSSFIVVFTFLYYPAISFRFTLFAVPLQIFIISMTEGQRVKTAQFAFLGLFVHLLLMIYLSKTYLEAFYV